MQIRYLDYHTCGEPVRIVTGGYPLLRGATILEKRRDARENHDHLRRAVMLEPRGHGGMYGVIPVAAAHPEAAFGVLFTHHEGYSTMCGHATIALGRYAIEHELVPAVEPVTRFSIEAPCGLLRLACTVRDGRVESVVFESVPAFVFARDLVVTLPGYGEVVTDIAYGGAFYGILPASRFGLDLFETPVATLTDAAAALTDHLRASLPVTHPTEPDLGFLYGTIITDDRSPTGSGVTARMALDHAKGFVETGVTRRFRSVTGGTFTGRVVGPVAGFADGAVTVAVGGTSNFAGEGTFAIEADDPLGHGFALPVRFAEIARG
ncbi:MAG: proline racemase [Bosea sp. 12-68-7]|nr:MAG: proline racemase [Bosea sp. 12-68-7]